MRKPSKAIFHGALERRKNHAGDSSLSFSLKRTIEIAHQNNLSPRAVELLALRNKIIPERCLRNIGSIGVAGQIKLLKSKAVIVGVGGIGGTVIELLARLGIGKIVIIDGDVFVDSNLNRQFLSFSNNLGKSKELEANRRLKIVNPSVQVQNFSIVAEEKNIPRIIEDSNVVIDGLDNIRSRFMVEKIYKKMRIPFVHGAVAGFSGQVATIFPEDPGLKRIYDSNRLPDYGIESELGTICIASTSVATFQVAEVIKILCGWPDTLRNKVLVFDFKKYLFEIVEFN